VLVHGGQHGQHAWPGFLEKVYENALAHELRSAGLAVERQEGLKVYYRDIVVGEYAADLLVEGLVVVELKPLRAFDNLHLAQCLNRLKAAGLKLSLLINCGTRKVQIKRVVNSF